MKTYHELNTAQQLQAIEICTKDVLNFITDGIFKFCSSDIQSRIDKACADANKNGTPWFTHEYLMSDNTLKELIYDMALSEVQECLYPEPGDNIPRYIFLKNHS